LDVRSNPSGSEIFFLEEEEEEEEEEDLFVFNDTIEGPRAPAVKPGASLKPDESEGCSPRLTPTPASSTQKADKGNWQRR
jgi:hypothetical protein